MVFRRLSVVGLLALCAWALAAGSAQAVHTNSPSHWCASEPTADPCIVSATFDGHAFTSTDPTYAVWAIPSTAGGASQVLWSVQPKVGIGGLTGALGHTFSITIRTSVVPRVVDGFGSSMSYARSGPSGGKYQVTITGQPVAVNDQSGCTYPSGGPICTGNAPGSSVLFQGEIDDFDYTNYADPSYPAGLVASFNGMDMWTNIAETGLPPNIVQSNGQNELQIDLADYHFEHDGTTLVHGNFYLRIPETFLSTMWGINDPNTLASDGLAASIGAGGGTLAVTVEPGNTGVQVQITGLTFSRRKLRIKLGHVTPAAPKNVKARRLTGTTARITFGAAKPHGQKVTGYSAKCGGKRFTVAGKRSPATIKGLTAGVGYSCTLQGRSRAGYGAASKRFSIPR